MPADALPLVDSLINDAKCGFICSPGQETKPRANLVAVAKQAPATAKPVPTAAKPEVAPPPPPASDLPKTEALYMTDTYLFTATATVLRITPLDEGKGYEVMLDTTCFHPQGGGQPGDVGTIASVDGGEPFAVAGCKKDPAGVVSHQGASAPAFSLGSTVKLVVDKASRLKNSCVHSAGHLIDVAMTQCGVGLKPAKGYHFTPGAYVEYDGKLEKAECDALIPRLQVAMDELIAKAVPTIVQIVNGVRIVSVGGMDCPCGGTHIRDTSELGKVTVEKVVAKGKVTRVSYSLEGSAHSL